MAGVVDSPELRTGRLLLQPVQTEHADALADALSDPTVYAFTGGTPEDAIWWRSRLAFLERRQSPDGRELWLNWVIRLAATSEIAGYVQATVRGPAADVAYVVGARWQGYGYALEATGAMVEYLVNALGVNEIRAWIADGHDASRAVAGRLGLTATDQTDEDGERLWVYRPAGAGTIHE
jgi:RimJ/RimL family protein N-acetyltransferase